MDPMHFSIKRVYWSGHARIRELVVPLGITPARADLLRVVVMHEQGMAQATLMQHLGVSPPTISKMLSAMVEKGWVERFASKNGNIIHATRAGVVLIAQVIQRFLLSGALPLRMAMAWGHGPGADRQALYRLLNRARRALLDRAPFLHPWRKEATYVRRHYTFWEARLRADDVDDTVAEDLEKIRARAKAPIACDPPPRTARELENIAAHRRDRDVDADGPLMWTDPPAGAAAAQRAAVDAPQAESDGPVTPVADEDGVAAPSVVDEEGVGALSVVDEEGVGALPVVDEEGVAAPPAVDEEVATATSHVDEEGVAAFSVVEQEVTTPSVGPDGLDGGPAASSLHGKGAAATSVVDGRETLAVADVPPEVLQLWKNLMELGNVRGLGLEDMPKWGEPES